MNGARTRIARSLTSGILPDSQLRAAAAAGWLQASVPFTDSQFQPASLDLRLGRVAYQLRASFLPFRRTVRERLTQNQFDFIDPDLVIDEIALEGGATLQRNSVYLVPLVEALNLPRHVRGRCNPKSTTGRLDIFTRVITDNTPKFDDIQAGYTGPLYIEISPQSFPVRIRPGIALSQLRLVVGDPTESDESLKMLHRISPILYTDDGAPVPLSDNPFQGGVCMGVDLSGRRSAVVGYRAHPNPPAVDLAKVDHYDPGDFWEPIRHTGKQPFILEANRFYILVSKERIRVPPDFAAEMAVYDAGAGEIRTHYAGFFDPGFGFGDGTARGTKVVMEVRARDVPVLLYDAQTLFTVRLERLQKRPDRLYGAGIGSSYENQSLTLSKQFRR